MATKPRRSSSVIRNPVNLDTTDLIETICSYADRSISSSVRRSSSVSRNSLFDQQKNLNNAAVKSSTDKSSNILDKNNSLNKMTDKKKKTATKPKPNANIATWFKDSHNAEGGEGGGGGGGGTKDNGEAGGGGGKPGEANAGSVHYVDACTLWKFPPWLVDRLDCSKIIAEASTIHSQQIRRTLLRQLKCTSTDLIMYATVRREFLRTILVIELNNCARLLEVANSLEIKPELKQKFFDTLQGCVTILEDENKSYSDDLVKLSQIMNEIYIDITPNVSLRELGGFTFNNVYCSYLIPGDVMKFTEMCTGGIVDNNWFSLESKYFAMVMVTPHVYDDPKNIERGPLKKEKYRLEAYFDVDRGNFTGFDSDLRQIMHPKYVIGIILEHLVYCFFSKTEHYVEEKSVFLMNGPETKGNVTFAKIYHGIVQTAIL